jgi:hypothetical protein
MFLPMAAHFAHTTIGARRVRSRRIKRSTIGAPWTLAKYGKPEIFNTDQGSQFTSPGFAGTHAEGSGRQDPDGWQGPPSASSSTSMQNSASIVLDSRQANTFRLAQSIIATS